MNNPKNEPEISCDVCSRSKCDHEDAEENESQSFPIALIFSILLAVAAFLMEHFKVGPVYVYASCFAVSAALAGWRVFISGLKAIFKLKLDETTLMTVAVVAAFCLGHFSEAAMVAILFELGEMLEDRAVDNSRDSIRKLVDIRPETAHRVIDSGEETVDAEEININDTILVHPYERVPLDGTVLEGSSSLDSSALTGESVPIEASQGAAVLSGMMNGQGLLKIRVTADFKNSAASRVIDLVESASAKKGTAEKLITRFARIYTPIVIGAAVLLAILPPLFSLGSFNTWVYRALIFLVASCPCALVISVPLGFYAGIGAESRSGVLIKGGQYLEALAKARAVVFDKTGTLTNGVLRVKKLLPFDGYSEADLLTSAAALEQFSAHPLAKAILAAADGLELSKAESPEEVPGHGIKGTVGGREVLCGRRKFLEDHGLVFPEDNSSATVFVAIDGKPAGEITLSDLPREDSRETVSGLKRLGIQRIVMLTGDSPHASEPVAKACGIGEFHAGLLPGDKVDDFEKIRTETGCTVFVGDGINDAPVLASADCGIAMGFGTDAAIEAADAVLMAGKPSALPPAIATARRSLRAIHFNIWFSLLVKAVVLLSAALGFAAIWMAVFADVGVCIIAVLNSSRILHFKVRNSSMD